MKINQTSYDDSQVKDGVYYDINKNTILGNVHYNIIMYVTEDDGTCSSCDEIEDEYFTTPEKAVEFLMMYNHGHNQDLVCWYRNVEGNDFEKPYTLLDEKQLMDRFDSNTKWY